MVPAVGPTNARIMLVGEAPGEQEVARREPFVGASGMLLNEMLHDAGITRAECFITNLARLRPPNNEITSWIATSKAAVTGAHIPLRNKMVLPPIAEGFELLQKEVSLVQPNVIVAFGNVASWALTGKWGIKSWRGSLLSTDSAFSSESRKVLPAYHPAYILRDYSQRYITTHDLRRAKKESLNPENVGPNYSFIIRPNYETVSKYLRELQASLETEQRTLAVDIETRAGHIACLGIATTLVDAICIPFMCIENDEGYWNESEEFEVVRLLQRVLCHANARIIGQNFIYDSQYIFRHWGFVPNFSRDTMLGHHCCFSGLPKGLDYLSSLYCTHHVYWKDEGKEWNPKIPEERLWSYNCKDAVVTFEADDAIQRTTIDLGLDEPARFQQAMFWPVLQAMVRGVRVDRQRRKALAGELRAAGEERRAWLDSVLGHPVNIRSPAQLKKLFYEDFKQKEIFNRKSGTVTLNEEALEKIATREPLLRPLVRNILEQRSLGVFLSTFVEARLDTDDRLRCSFNIAGTETFRLSSSENAFGSGLNLQNIPKGDQGLLPNVRKIFIPDEGYTFFDGDLSKADAQVVAWEANDEALKQLFREGYDLHAENAKSLGISYDLAKRWVHATNYAGKPRTMSISCGITVHKAEQMYRRWFEIHPGILKWQQDTERELRSKRFVQNKFGYRRYYFDRVDTLLPEALAWKGQSTVGIYINRVWMRVYLEQPDIQILLQVHDSLAGQIPSEHVEELKQSLLDIAAGVMVPYDDPLVIPFRIKTSPLSWGDCQ